jgi:hypothetical protein
MNKKTFLTILFFGFLLLFLIPQIPAYAQEPIMEQLPDKCREKGECEVNDLVELLVIGANYIIAYSGVLALVAFVYGGVLFLISAGQSDRVQKGKNIILGSLIGLAVVFLSYTIIQYIGNALGIDKFGISSGWF